MKPSTYRCLKLLRDQESVTTHDFLIAGCGSRFGARLAELRHEHGCVIDEHKLSDRSGSRYRLIAEPDTYQDSVRHDPEPNAPTGPTPAPPLGVHPAARADSSRAGIASAWPGVTLPSLSGATPGPATSHREGDAALTTAAASTQARGSGSTGTDRRRERNGTIEAARRPEPLTGQSTSGAGPLAGRLVDKAATNRANVPASDAVPPADSRTVGGPSSDPSPSPPLAHSGEAPALTDTAPSLLLAGASGQANTSGARCAIYDDDWEDQAA